VTVAYLGLGSNVGDRESHLAHALRRLDQDTDLRAVSAVYETEPVGFVDQGPFLNMVARVDTDRRPEELLRLARDVEEERQRARTFRNAPRTLDIDILLYGRRMVRGEGLTIPHPRMHERPFVLVPLLDLDPDLTEPGTGRLYRQLLESAGGATGVRAVMDGAELLTREAE
jgi:2-amino-4-hydroxy-6-hydroxymethyldihydropteridine diphosphokinase